MIEISEEDAVVLLRVCDAVTLKGWSSKLAVGKAQRALEMGLQPKPEKQAQQPSALDDEGGKATIP